jgi:hypothetical protein
MPASRYQPKVLLCRTLARLWFFPSLGALVMLGLGFRGWPHPDDPLGVLRAVTFEQWVALAVLLAHAAFWLLAWRFTLTEPFREVQSQEEIAAPPAGRS